MENLKITLTSAGSDADNFSLYSNEDGFVTPFVTGVTRAQILTGYEWNTEVNPETIIRVKSNTLCQSSVDLKAYDYPNDMFRMEIEIPEDLSTTKFVLPTYGATSGPQSDTRPKYRFDYSGTKGSSGNLFGRDLRATRGVDWGFDAVQAYPGAGFAFLIGESSTRYIIMSEGIIDESTELKVSINGVASGEGTLSLSPTSTSLIYHLNPVLKDVATGQIVHDFTTGGYTTSFAAGLVEGEYTVNFIDNGLNKENAPIIPSMHSYIDWGDGTIVTNTDVNHHTYASPGKYIISVGGPLIGFNPLYTYFSDKIKKIITWGPSAFGTVNLGNCENLTHVPVNPPIYSGTSPMTNYFLHNCNNLRTDISAWPISPITLYNY